MSHCTAHQFNAILVKGTVMKLVFCPFRMTETIIADNTPIVHLWPAAAAHSPGPEVGSPLFLEGDCSR